MKHDVPLANAKAGIEPIDESPKGLTWHHVEDGRTMELVPQDLHNAAKHTGSRPGLPTDSILVEPGGSYTPLERFLRDSGAGAGATAAPAAATASEP